MLRGVEILLPLGVRLRHRPRMANKRAGTRNSAGRTVGFWGPSGVPKAEFFILALVILLIGLAGFAAFGEPVMNSIFSDGVPKAPETSR